MTGASVRLDVHCMAPGRKQAHLYYSIVIPGDRGVRDDTTESMRADFVQTCHARMRCAFTTGIGTVACGCSPQPRLLVQSPQAPNQSRFMTSWSPSQTFGLPPPFLRPPTLQSATPAHTKHYLALPFACARQRIPRNRLLFLEYTTPVHHVTAAQSRR